MADVQSSAEPTSASAAVTPRGLKMILVASVAAAGLAFGTLVGTMAVLIGPGRTAEHGRSLEPEDAGAVDAASNHEARGDEKLLEQDYAAALACYRRTAPPEHAPPLLSYRMAVCLEGLGKWDQAQQIYSDLAQEHPNTVLEFACRLALSRLATRRGQTELATHHLGQAILRASEGTAQIPAAIAQARLSFAVISLQRRMPTAQPGPLEPTLAWPSWPVEPPEESWLWLRGLRESAVRPWPIVRESLQITPAAQPQESLITLQLPRGSCLELLRRLAQETGLELSVSEKATATLKSRTLEAVRLANFPLAEVLTLLLEPEDCLWYHVGRQLFVLTDQELAVAGSADVRDAKPVTVGATVTVEPPRVSLRQRVAETYFRSVLVTLNRLLLETSNTPLPQVHRLIAWMGLCHYQLGQLTEAALWWERLIARWSQTPEAFYASFNLGVLYWRQGQLELGKRFWLRAADQNPGHSLANLAYLYVARAELEQLQVESAMAPLRRAAYAPANSPVRCIAQLWLACCWLYLDNAAAAHDLLVRERQALQKEPYRYSAAFLDALARAQLAGGSAERMRRAEELLAALLHVHDWQLLEPLGPLLGGRAWMHLHLPEQAGRLYQTVLTRSRSICRLELLLAYAESALLCRQFDQLRQAVQELLRSGNPDYEARAHWLLARCALEEGHPEQCLEHARQVLLRPAKVPMEALLRLMGEAYAALGDASRAAHCFAGRIPEP